MSDKHAHNDDFDGIKEEDNPMPDWWLWTFLLSIIFAAIYFIHYHVATDDSLAKEYQEEKMRVEASIAAHGPSLSDLAAKVVSLSGDEMTLTSGLSVYTQQCAACHGPQGEGLIGPNLTDKHSIHGQDPNIMVKVVTEGVLTKGMPAWGQMLSQEDLLNVIVYVNSLAGKMLPGKAPEGEEFN